MTKNQASCRRYYQANKEKLKALENGRNAANPLRNKNALLKKKYKITADDYLALLAAQGGVCKICSQPEKAKYHRSGKPLALAVDHCHKTGKVRGLLCGGCDGGLGLFKDDPEHLKLAIKYLEESQCA